MPPDAPLTAPVRPPKRPRPALLITVLALALTLAVITILGRDVVRKLDALETAQSDNVQWTLSRLEVERLRLAAAIDQAQDDPVALGGVRQSFDLFYSRVQVIADGQAYALLRADTQLQAPLQAITDYLALNVPRIDGSDAALLAGLPILAATTQALRVPVRDVQLGGLTVFSQTADSQRAEISRLLTLASSASVLLLLALSVLAFFLLRNVRISAARAARLGETSTRLETMVSTSLDAILVADTAGRVLEFNGAAEKIFGYTRSEATGALMADLIVPDHHVAAHNAGMTRYLSTGEKRVLGKGRVQLEAKRKSGEIFPCELSISSAITPQGEIFVSFLRDISARKAAEAEVLDARDRALAGERAKASFMAVMSHEMRTPLNGIIGSLELIDTVGLDANQRQYFDMISFSSNRLLEHVNDVLDISKIEADPSGIASLPIDLADTLRGCIDSQSSSAQVVGNVIELSMLSPIPVLLGDPKKLRQIVLNLLGNANKFTKAGRITLEVECHPGTLDSCTIEMRVADTGIGIPEADIDRVFEDFVTLDSAYNRDHGGTGLGLGITRRLVQALGGEIGVESEPGVGSVFWLRLPFDIAPATALAAPAGGTGPGGPTIAARKVLLVEDNEINLIVARRMLEADGHKVTTATDGSDGIVLAGQDRYDVILMDISMPQVDGITATQRIQAGNGASAKTPIVALTAHTSDADVAAFRDAGMIAHLAKPLTRDALRETLLGLFPAAVATPTAALGSVDPVPDLAALFAQNALADLFGPEQARDLRRKFIAQVGGLVPLLETSEGGSATAHLLAEVHKLKGAVGVFGMDDLLAEITGFEARLKTGDTAAARELATTLRPFLALR